MKINKIRIKKLIKEAIVSAIDPAIAKKEAINLLRGLDKKMKNDPNMQPYYSKLHELYKGILSYPGDAFANLIPKHVWATGEQAINLIEGVLMMLPEDEEYNSIMSNLNKMYDVFHRSKDGGYGEYYDRQRLMAAAQHGQLMEDFLSGNLEKLASENPDLIHNVGAPAADNPGYYDDFLYKSLVRYANELDIMLDFLAMIPGELQDSPSATNHLHDQILSEINRNKTGMITEHPLKYLKPEPYLTVTRHHAQTSKGILPFLVVSEYGYANIFLPISVESMANSQNDIEED